MRTLLWARFGRLRCIVAPFVLVLPRLYEAVHPSDDPALFQRDIVVHNRVGDGHRWLSGGPLFSPGQSGFDSSAVKDPSIVFHAGNWHLFYTARDHNQYTMGYARAAQLEGLSTASRFQLEHLHGKTSTYGCAPQVFFFEPHKMWYLLFQTADKPSRFHQPYSAVISTNPNIEDVNGWSNPEPLLKKDSMSRWIDFWVICDDARAYLFYTQDQDQVMVRSTPINNFPSGWSKPALAVDNVHEAAHVYKVKGLSEYHMIYELRNKGERSMGMARAERLSGPWRKVTEHYAEGSQLAFVRGVPPWTSVVSHGEALRSGSDQRLEYEPQGARWLVQGMAGLDDGRRQYDDLQWSLGLINMTL